VLARHRPPGWSARTTRQRLQAQFAYDTGEIAKGMKMAMNQLNSVNESPHLIRFLSTGWLSIGEYSEVLLSEYDQHHPFALNGLGKKKAGQSLAEKFVKARPDNVDQQQAYMNYLFLEGDWETLTSYYLNTYGNVKSLKDSDAYPPLEKVAAALVQTNHPHAKEMIEVCRAHINAQREGAIKLAVLDHEESILLLLENKPDTALLRLQSAFDKGSYDLHIRKSPIYEQLSGHPDYEILTVKTQDAINAERAKLDLNQIILPE